MNDSTLTFYPRAEARAMPRDELYPPVLDAVRELLLLLSGAEDAADLKDTRGDYPDLSSCFLVYGDRGTGKSTVLLTAREATTHPNHFYPSSNDKKTNEPLPDEVAAHNLNLRVAWLDVLDVEPLPPGANLLTTLLVRIQRALDLNEARGEEHLAGHADRQRVSALFNGEADDAHRQIGNLLRDASLMWEDISEVDTRSRAERQVAAAQTYASFRGQFVKAMAAVSQHLSQRLGVKALVLPIDNIDRSTDHLRAIIKLAQLVSCRHLWFVLAGDRVDVDTFLRRAFWKELIRTGEGVVRGRERLSGEDDALSIARRQAASAGAKVIPYAHRIKVQPISAKDALASKFPSGGTETLADKLDALALDISVDGPQSERLPRSLLDLMDIGRFLSEEVSDLLEPGIPREKRARRLSFAARHALNLPVRCLNDLHQLADGARAKDGRADEHRDAPAHTVARRMLQHAIDGTDLPEWVCKRLQHDVIGRDSAGRSTLTIRGSGLRADDIQTRLAALDVDRDGTSRPVEVNVISLADLRMRVWRDPGCADRDAGMSAESALLPSSVASWFMLLYDLLMFSEHPLVYRDHAEKLLVSSLPVRTRHEVDSRLGACTFDVTWPAAPLSTYWEADLLRTLWEAAVERNRRSSAAVIPDTLVSQWIDAVLSVTGSSSHRVKQRGVPRGELAGVLKTAHARGKALGAEGLASQRTWADVAEREVRRWLEDTLPVMLFPEVGAARRDQKAWRSLLPRVASPRRVVAARRSLVRGAIVKAAKRLTADATLQAEILAAAEKYLNDGLPSGLHVELDLGAEPDQPRALALPGASIAGPKE